MTIVFCEHCQTKACLCILRIPDSKTIMVNTGGRGVVNPTSMLLSTSMMLSYLGEVVAAKRLQNALQETIKEGIAITPDMGGNAGTMEMAETIAKKVAV